MKKRPIEKFDCWGSAFVACAERGEPISACIEWNGHRDYVMFYLRKRIGDLDDSRNWQAFSLRII